MEIHMIDRPVYKCNFPDCSYSVHHLKSFKEHIKINHEKVLDFECHCGMKFAFPYLLNAHRKKLHGEKKIVCEVCGKSFTCEANKRAHVKYSHLPIDKIEKFPCEICGKTYMTRSNVRKHMKSHGSPQQNCQFCDKKYYFKDSLLVHQKIHAFPCQHENCKRSFKDQSGLNDHLEKTHNKVKVQQCFRCEVCGKVFTLRSNIRKHLIKVHKQLNENYKKDLLERIKTMQSE
jgi:uncharacterized C2H2 Zn-finger protein